MVGGLVFIGGNAATDAEVEIAVITAITGSTCTLQRGCLDTVPREWSANTPAWFVNLTDGVADPAIRSDGETVTYRLLPETSLGALDYEDAPDLTATLSGRPHYPNRPADVKVMGVGFTNGITEIDATAVVDPTIPVTWAIRDRSFEDSQILAWNAPSTSPEAGQTTTVEVRTEAGVLITAHTGLAGSSFDLPIASFGASRLAMVRVLSERDGLTSLQYHALRVRVDPEPTIDFSGDQSPGHELLSGDMNTGMDAVNQSGTS